MKQFPRSQEIEAAHVHGVNLAIDRSQKHAWYGLVAPLPHSEVTTQWACRVFLRKEYLQAHTGTLLIIIHVPSFDLRHVSCCNEE